MFKGIYTPVVTPFTKDEKVDYHAMKHNLDIWAKTGLDGIVVLGSNGEFVYLTKEEKFQVIEFVVNNFTKDKKIIVGTSCESVYETVEMNKRVAEIGADAVLVLPPHYYTSGMKEDILYGYFKDVADESPLPVMIYNMPGNTGINISASLIAKLAKHPNIVGVKDTSGNIVQIAEIVRDTDEDFIVFAGNAGYLLPALAVGARGATLALANILPEKCVELVENYRNGNMVEALKIQQSLLEINNYVTSKLGVSGLKYALDQLGYKGGYTRRPLRELSDDNKKDLDRVLKEFK
ncbi:MAG: 4-hydroxy-tetrahydrodipicolinate synthase [Clostridia bacterium]|nr:4-hydroxy-tetrahydrodipicolinate synthase [Clostridia bacterium]